MTPLLPTARRLPQVSPIVEDVRARGDAAVLEYTAKFDRVQMEAVCTPIGVRRRCAAGRLGYVGERLGRVGAAGRIVAWPAGHHGASGSCCLLH